MKRSVHEKVFFILILLVVVLGSLNIAKANGLLVPDQPNVEILENTIVLSDLKLESKIAQMVVVGGSMSTGAWKRMNVGGVHIFALEDETVFSNAINKIQKNEEIPMFITADFEGCVTPFGHMFSTKSNSEIKSEGEALDKGLADGKILADLGFNVNFAPVVDLEDSIWKCRAYKGDVAKKAQAYIQGLQNNGILGVAKHYPGKTLVVRDPHKFLVTAEIDKEDIEPYSYLAKQGDLGGIMISHLITTGEVDSENIPTVVSENVYDGVSEIFDGLLVSDEIHMLGLKSFYSSLDEMYIAVFKAGNDLVLNFDRDPTEVYRMIRVIVKAVERGEISEDKIDGSVRKILEAKGFTVVE